MSLSSSPTTRVAEKAERDADKSPSCGAGRPFSDADKRTIRMTLAGSGEISAEGSISGDQDRGSAKKSVIAFQMTDELGVVRRNGGGGGGSRPQEKLRRRSCDSWQRRSPAFGQRSSCYRNSFGVGDADSDDVSSLGGDVLNASRRQSACQIFTPMNDVSKMYSGSNGKDDTATDAGSGQNKKSMVESVLEEFPEDDDSKYRAHFTSLVDMEEIVCLDVGGDRYHIKRGILTRLPNTRLGRLARCASNRDAIEFCDIPYNVTPPEYFFDRNGDNFASILDIYRTNMFHLSAIGCALVLQKDLDYWGIDELMMEPCCALKYYPEIETCVNEKQGDLKQKQREKEQADDENFGETTWGHIRTFLWNVMEYPWTSNLAQFVAFFSLGMVVVSTLTFIISTMEEFQAMDSGQSEYTAVVVILDYIDTFVIVFFTLEYFMRFVCSPRKWRFFKNPMNLVDLFAIIPFYLSVFLAQLEDIQIIGKAGKIVRLIRVMRILRIFKLVRHFAGLQSLFYTLRQAYKELGLLMLLVAVAILTFSSLVYFAEKEGHDQTSGLINSWTFVESFWWGLMTITTCGYDLSPQTFLGKLIGGFCALSGIFILTLPIPIVVNSFASYYKNRLWRNEVAQKKRERALAQAAEEKAMQKFYLIKAMAMPMTGKDINAPSEAMCKVANDAAESAKVAASGGM